MRRWWPVVVALVVLAGVAIVAVAAADGGFPTRGTAPDARCAAPALPGTVVDVALTDMGAMMRGRDAHGPGDVMGSGGYGHGPAGPMRVLLSRASAPAGTVSFQAANTGGLVHELVVLPLAPGASAGERSIGADDRVSETGSLGEASATCGEGAGDGIDPGAVSWVTLHLAAGNYELICNLPGHYAAGMDAELRVG